jgi:hypothetical protein
VANKRRAEQQLQRPAHNIYLNAIRRHNCSKSSFASVNPHFCFVLLHDFFACLGARFLVKIPASCNFLPKGSVAATMDKSFSSPNTNSACK